MSVPSLARLPGAARDRPRIALLADRRLVGQAIAAALLPRWFAPMLFEWPRRKDRIPNIHHRLERSGVTVGVIVCDLATPDRLYDVEHLVMPALPQWIVLTDSDPGPRWGNVLEAGAAAVLPTSTGVDDLVDAVREVAAGGSPMPPDVRDRVIDAWHEVEDAERELLHRMEQLTPRESQVLAQLYEGVPVSRIARAAGVSESTVRTQVKTLRTKLNAESQLAAVAMYRRALAIFPSNEHR